MTIIAHRVLVALPGALLAAVAAASPPPAWTDSPVARLEALALIQTLNAEILSSNSATLTLERWCRDHALADPAVIVARRVDSAAAEPSAATRRELQVSAKQTIRFRRVELMCGDHVLSVAENWYVPARLTAQMNRLLDTTQTPFGKAVLSLQPHREIMSAQLLWQPLPEEWALLGSPAGAQAHPDALLEVPQTLFETRAVVYTSRHQAIAEVNEVYQRDLLAFPQPQLPVR